MPVKASSDPALNGKPRLLTRDDVARLVGLGGAITAVRHGLIQMARGRAISPEALELQFPTRRGEVHVRAGYVAGADNYAVKSASGFYENVDLGLPTADGLTLICDARTGQLRYLVLDRGLLTDLRTAAAGALSVDALARADVSVATILGAGIQARLQLRALLKVRDPRTLHVWARSRKHATDFAREAEAIHKLDVQVFATAASAVEHADVVITATAATEPILVTEAVRRGTHVTAVGSDTPDKQELAPELLAAADKTVIDGMSATAHAGELFRAIEQGFVTKDSVHAELGQVLAGLRPGRQADDELTIADLTGLGVEDAAIANTLAEAAVAVNAGVPLPVSGGPIQ